MFLAIYRTGHKKLKYVFNIYVIVKYKERYLFTCVFKIYQSYTLNWRDIDIDSSNIAEMIIGDISQDFKTKGAEIVYIILCYFI